MSPGSPIKSGHDSFVVSPEASREKLAELIGAAKKQLLIYDDRVTDRLMLRLLKERAAAGVEIRIIGRIAKPIDGVSTRKLSDLRLHVRAIICDGARAFVGSQSLRKLELDSRREVGLIAKDAKIAKRMVEVFEADWALSGGDKKKDEPEVKADKTEEKEVKPDKKRRQIRQGGQRQTDKKVAATA